MEQQINQILWITGTKEPTVIFAEASKIISIWNWFLKSNPNFWRPVIFKSKENFAPAAITWSPAQYNRQKKETLISNTNKK